MNARNCSLCLALLVAGRTAVAAGDPGRGAQVFRQCAACHSVQAGEHMTGPSLAHIAGRKAGTAEGFMRYSDAMRRVDVIWNDPALDKWLANPEKFLPGTSMTFPGLKESRDRHDVIAYLRAVSEGKAPQQSGRGTMAMARPKADLRNAPPAGQVRSIAYCGDTYTVETADGKKEKVWEFNLRFKSDSSKLGPAPGRPVVLGAGMQGDRAAIVFASPKEISDFVKQACP